MSGTRNEIWLAEASGADMRARLLQRGCPPLEIADRDDRQALVAQLLKSHYPEVFGLPPNATQSELDDVFREVFAQSGATLRKGQTFLLHGAAYAGLFVGTGCRTLTVGISGC